MALVGGGGAGYTAGAGGTTGTGKGLNYVGDDPTYAFAYSGIFAVGSAGQDTPSTLLDFTTGNSFMTARLHVVRGYPTGSVAHDYLWILKINGESVFEYYDSTEAGYELPGTNIIIPGNSRIQVTAQNSTAATNNNVGVIITGRVYA